MKKLFKNLFVILAITSVAVSCDTITDEDLGDTTKELITIGVNTESISYEDLGSKSSSSNLLAIQIYQEISNIETPYAYGLFTDYSSLSFEGYTNTTYRVVATMVVNGTEEIYKDGESYGLPFSSAVTSEMEYSTSEYFSTISSSKAQLTDGETYSNPSIDRYYGYASKYITSSDATISTSMLRMSAGLKIAGTTESVVVKIAGAPEVSLTSDDTFIFSLSDFDAAYTTPNYSESISTQVELNGEVIYNNNVTYIRNKAAIATVSSDKTSVDFDFETPFEDQDTDTDIDSAVTVTSYVVNFEDEEYSWSDLIDSIQYGGELLYGAWDSSLYDGWGGYVMIKDYAWADTNTGLSFSTSSPYSYGGGMAISNYTKADYNTTDYDEQLAVPFSSDNIGGGFLGSNNFVVANSYSSFSFGDESKTITSMKVAPTSYLLSVMTNGNKYASSLNEKGDYFYVTATGYDINGSVTGTSDFYFAIDGVFVTDWTEWDLSTLGEVNSVTFTFDGSDSGEYGLNTPTYFAYDDVFVTSTSSSSSASK